MPETGSGTFPLSIFYSIDFENSRNGCLQGVRHRIRIILFVFLRVAEAEFCLA